MENLIISLLKFFCIIMIILIILLIVGFCYEVTKYLKKEKFNLLKIIKIFAIYGGVGLIIWIAPFILIKSSDYEIYSSDNENLKEKTAELTESEKLKKLNAYRKKKEKEILLVEKKQSDKYIEYLKKNKLDKKALK